MTSPSDFADAFLDSTYLKLDEGALAFIFGRARVAQAAALDVAQAQALVTAQREALKQVVADTARHILKDAFYMRLFEELSELPDDTAFAFINLCLRRVEDTEVESARAAVVSEIAAQRRRKPVIEPK